MALGKRETRLEIGSKIEKISHFGILKRGGVIMRWGVIFGGNMVTSFQIYLVKSSVSNRLPGT